MQTSGPKRPARRSDARLSEEQFLRLGAALTGATLMASAALAGDLAREHMLALGAICGAAPHPHCGWCFGAAGLDLAGLAAFALAFTGPSLFRKPGLLQIKATNGKA